MIPALGATYRPEATSFAVWAPEATAVELCLYDEAGDETRLPVADYTSGVWHRRVPDIKPGRRYGYRVDGPWRPECGQRFNPAKLLLDPYARAITGCLDPEPEIYGHRLESSATAERDRRDSAPYVPRSVVVDSAPTHYSDHPRPRVPWPETVIYELHVKGFTARHPAVPPQLRGTYAGLAHPSVIGYLRDLGITTVELLPVQQFLSEPALLKRGMTNYWGYNTIGFFAPHGAYAAGGDTGGQVCEFQAMVAALHAAGIEVLLDVVYNHTAEGGVDGPTLAFRGYGDGAYYRRDEHGRYADLTGCGNTIAAARPPSLTLILDSLRYWVRHMHVDGFRFDLAPALARTDHKVDLHGPLFTAISHDPVLRDVKLVAEPWDVTSVGYQVGRFPPPWAEWNDRFRDTVRDFWRGRPHTTAQLGTRVAGSSDLYAGSGRPPYASVNFVTAHDGFTLRDLVSYNHKHNEGNGEHNRDGTNDNRSRNLGVEGETDDSQVLQLRQRHAANLMSTLLLATGVPMLVAGDERGRTQRGNNNAFCQDNEISWVDWRDETSWSDLLAVTRRLLALRREHAVLRRRDFFTGRPTRPGGRKDLTWLNLDGGELDAADWGDPNAATIGYFLAGDVISDRTSSLLVWLHAGESALPIILPTLAVRYDEVLRTDDPDGWSAGRPTSHEAGATLVLPALSVVVLSAR